MEPEDAPGYFNGIFKLQRYFIYFYQSNKTFKISLWRLFSSHFLPACLLLW